MKSYDAGLLNDYGGGNIGWWQDYIRSELASADEYYQTEISRPEVENEELRKKLEMDKCDGKCILHHAWKQHTEELKDQLRTAEQRVAREIIEIMKEYHPGSIKSERDDIRESVVLGATEDIRTKYKLKDES